MEKKIGGDKNAQEEIDAGVFNRCSGGIYGSVQCASCYGGQQ